MIACIPQPSPNSNERTLPVSLLVMHYTGMPSGEAALARLCDPASKVSAHYLAEEDGRVFQLVEESRRAWHAGKGYWRGIEDINSASIGIEIVNPGHEFGYRVFPEVQMQAVLELAQGILARHAIPARNVVGHSDTAPARKEDPGELFNWQWLAENGVGLYPSPPGGGRLGAEGGRSALNSRDAPPPQPSPSRGEGVIAIQQKLAEYGYGIAVTGEWDAAGQAVARAFQRHFRQSRVDGVWDGECGLLLDSLLKVA